MPKFTITAEVRTDDGRQARFDTVQWFDQATISEIRSLVEVGWGGNSVADGIGQWVAEDDESLVGVFDHIEETGCGYRCDINQPEAEKWLRANRPNVYHELTTLRLVTG